MNTPPLLIGITLVFWGWQTGWVLTGLLLGTLLELTRLIGPRWELSQENLDRIWNFCLLLFLGSVVYVFAIGEGSRLVGDWLDAQTPGTRSATLNQGARAVLQLFQWLPLVLLPIVAAQALMAGPGMDPSTFSWWLRRQRQQPQPSGPPRRTPKINAAFPYVAVCLFAASASNRQSPVFFAGLTLILGWSLWHCRPAHRPVTAWFGIMVSALALGLGLQASLQSLRSILQRWDTALVSRFSGGSGFDEAESRTQLGSVGRTKLSGAIRFHLKALEGAPPDLVREAVYNLYREPVWGTTDRQFKSLAVGEDLQTWPLQIVPEKSSQVAITGALPGGQGLLPLPLGASKLERLLGFDLATNALGMVRVEEGDSFLDFLATFHSNHATDRPPGQDDFQIPEEEKATLTRVANELDLPRASTEESLAIVRQYFQNHFVYATWRGLEHRPDKNHTALELFLTQHRSGHCEYFATATTLLLRAAGIPARYAVGYAVQEKQGSGFVIRARHAHAWCLAWVDGRWREIDTTPGTWFAADAKEKSFWEPVTDWLSHARIQWARWRRGENDWRRYLSWFALPLLGVLAIRILWAKPWKARRASSHSGNPSQPYPGLDSEFYTVANRMEEAGYPRNPQETWSAWISRVSDHDRNRLEEILQLHYRLRFDPQGIASEEREHLRQLSERWLAQN